MRDRVGPGRSERMAPRGARMLLLGALVASGAVGASGAEPTERPPRPPEDATALRDDPWVQPLAPGVWRHVSYRELPESTVVWLAEPRILFGGCLVRGWSAKSMGNTSDADLASWPGAISFLQLHYPAPILVVPGHGDPGGPELLAHTVRLLAAHQPKQRN